MLDDGRVTYRIRYARRGSTHRVMTPVDLLARLAALIPARKDQRPTPPTKVASTDDGKPATAANGPSLAGNARRGAAAQSGLSRHYRTAREEQGSAAPTCVRFRCERGWSVLIFFNIAYVRGVNDDAVLVSSFHVGLNLHSDLLGVVWGVAREGLQRAGQNRQRSCNTPLVLDFR